MFAVIYALTTQNAFIIIHFVALNLCHHINVPGEFQVANYK